MELGRKRLKKHVGYMINNDKTIKNDLVKLRDLMHELAGFKPSDKCMEICPCFPYCQTHMEYDCYQLIASYCDKELSRMLRGLDGD